MKCNKCDKQIPTSSKICPYCSTPVEVNYEQHVEFGDISNINYDQKHDLKAYVQEPKKSKSNIISILTILLIFAAFGGLAFFIFFPKEERLDKYFMRTLYNINEYIEDNFLGSNYEVGGEYKLNISINGEAYEFNGRYERDINKKILKLDGIKRDSNEYLGGVILNSKEFSFDIYSEDNNLYFKSPQLFDNYLKFDLHDDIGLLTTKDYNLDILLKGVYDGLKYSLSHIDYKKETTKINYRGYETDTDRYYFILDNKGKIKFITTFYNKLIDDTNFINECAKLNNKQSDEIIELFKNKINDVETKYSEDNNDSMTFSIYVNNKKIVRYYIDIVEENHKVYQLDIKDNKYFFDYYLNDKNEISSTLIKTEENIDGVKNINYAITFDTDKYVTDIVIDFKPDEKSQVENETIDDITDFKTITEEEKNILKSNLLKYTNRTDLVDILREYYKEKCILGIECDEDKVIQSTVELPVE